MITDFFSIRYISSNETTENQYVICFESLFFFSFLTRRLLNFFAKRINLKIITVRTIVEGVSKNSGLLY